MTINPERVTITIENHIAQLRLTRADKMNAVDPDMAEAVVAAGRHLMGLTDLRAVVISGEGRGFCAGLDVASFAKFAATDP
ncbi:MAG: enoyl-CoA hydratase, partial [Rhodobacteraceae bacterium]|nr:enoyl-CoA hydratase [Paracoccaceae bacterium]